MKRIKSIRVQLFFLVLSIVCVLLSAAPLFEKHNDAQILVLFFGAFAAGATVSNMIGKLKKPKDNDNCER